MGKAEWIQAAHEAKCSPAVITILTAIAAVHALYPCARGGSGEIGLGAAPDAYAGLYISHRGITLALDPEHARAFADSFELLRVAKSQATHYVACPSARLGEPAPASRVESEAERATARSWQGPRWSRQGSSASAPARLTATCPIHHYELSVTGYCVGCDDHAPSL